MTIRKFMHSAVTLVRSVVVSVSMVCLVLTLLNFQGYFSNAANHGGFRGNGTENNPYIIDSLRTLEKFRDAVNNGTTFEGQYFRQTVNIDLQGKDWIPIGIYGGENYFRGIYDGDGHYVENLSVSGSHLPAAPANNGFFGILEGTVKNFGIESGSIYGFCVGSITSHARMNAVILNCYNKASVTGDLRAGGIGDNLGSSASILNCANFGEITAPVSGEVLSYDAGFVAAISPVESGLPDTFHGTYLPVEITGTTSGEMLNHGVQYLISDYGLHRLFLNHGLHRLIEEGVIDKKEIVFWR